MAYQRIFQPGPSSNRFPFHGVGACCSACAVGLPCGAPLGDAKLTTGGPGGSKEPGGSVPAGQVGTVPELEALARDVKALAQQAQAAWGDVALNRTLYDRLKRQASAPATGTFQFTGREAQQFVTGTVVDVTAAYVKAHELAVLAAPTAARRDQLRATQRQLAQSARRMLDQALAVLRSARPAHATATSGLGLEPLTILAIAAVVTAVILASGAAVYSWVQASSELNAAMVAADRICRETPGGCTAAQRAAIVNSLRMPDPITEGVRNVTRGIGSGLETVIVVLGIGGAVSLVGWAWLRFSKSGRRVSARMAQGIERRLG